MNDKSQKEMELIYEKKMNAGFAKYIKSKKSKRGKDKKEVVKEGLTDNPQSMQNSIVQNTKMSSDAISQKTIQNILHYQNADLPYEEAMDYVNNELYGFIKTLGFSNITDVYDKVVQSFDNNYEAKWMGKPFNKGKPKSVTG